MKLMTAPLYAVILLCSATNERSPEDADARLLKSLRRQLIKDNYDYMTDMSEEYESENYNLRKKYKSDKMPAEKEVLLDKYMKPQENNEYNIKYAWNNRRKDISKDVKNINYHGSISEKELIDENLKLMNRTKNRRRKQKRKKKNDPTYDKPITTDKQPAQEDRISYGDMGTIFSTPILPKVTKYKILRIKDTYRRSNNLATLIQEETPDSVAVVNLGNGPFPQFRLPSSRRQYMHDPLDIGAFIDDDELPPPPVNDTTYSSEAFYAVTNIQTSTTQIEGPANNKLLESLKITVTPDEILVL